MKKTIFFLFFAFIYSFSYKKPCLAYTKTYKTTPIYKKQTFNFIKLKKISIKDLNTPYASFKKFSKTIDDNSGFDINIDNKKISLYPYHTYEITLYFDKNKKELLNVKKIVINNHKSVLTNFFEQRPYTIYIPKTYDSKITFYYTEIERTKEPTIFSIYNYNDSLIKNITIQKTYDLSYSSLDLYDFKIYYPEDREYYNAINLNQEIPIIQDSPILIKDFKIYNSGTLNFYLHNTNALMFYPQIYNLDNKIAVDNKDIIYAINIDPRFSKNIKKKKGYYLNYKQAIAIKNLDNSLEGSTIYLKLTPTIQNTYKIGKSYINRIPLKVYDYTKVESQRSTIISRQMIEKNNLTNSIKVSFNVSNLSNYLIGLNRGKTDDEIKQGYFVNLYIKDQNQKIVYVKNIPIKGIIENNLHSNRLILPIIAKKDKSLSFKLNININDDNIFSSSNEYNIYAVVFHREKPISSTVKIGKFIK